MNNPLISKPILIIKLPLNVYKSDNFDRHIDAYRDNKQLSEQYNILIGINPDYNVEETTHEILQPIQYFNLSKPILQVLIPKDKNSEEKIKSLDYYKSNEHLNENYVVVFKEEDVTSIKLEILNPLTIMYQNCQILPLSEFNPTEKIIL